MVTFTRDIGLSAEALSLGETVRIHCNRCQGGRPTLTITRNEDGSVVWNCYRASCDNRGAYGARGGGRPSRVIREEVPKFRPYLGTLRALDDGERAILAGAAGFDDEHCRHAAVRWASEDSRFAFPILAPNGQRRGWVLRTWNNLVRTKALTHMERDEPHLSWYFAPLEPGMWTGTIIVEDIPSAVRAARYANAVALCGTTCGMAYANEIAGVTDSVVWALDADATAKAIEFWREYRVLFEESSVLPLAQDLKNMTEPALAALMEDL